MKKTIEKLVLLAKDYAELSNEMEMADDSCFYHLIDSDSYGSLYIHKLDKESHHIFLSSSISPFSSYTRVEFRIYADGAPIITLPANFDTNWLEEIYYKATRLYRKLLLKVKDNGRKQRISDLFEKEKQLKKISEEIAEIRKALIENLEGK